MKPKDAEIAWAAFAQAVKRNVQLQARIAATKREQSELVVGQYTIRHQGDGFYIEHESGEGMACKTDALEAVITQFYAENF